jgi:hypothetical protein
MNKRKTLLVVVRQGLIGLAIKRGRTVDLFTCPQTAAALGLSLKWVHKYARSRRRGLLFQLGRPLLWREEVGHLQRELAKYRMARSRQQSINSKVTQRRP